MDEKEQLENIARYQLFRYSIRLQNGVDILEPFDLPGGWHVLTMENKALLCASNPADVPVNERINKMLAKKMGAVLRERNFKYNLVDRQALEPKTFLPIGDICRAFFVHDISEREAEEISNLFCAPFFLYWDYDPDLHIRIIPCPKSKFPITGLYFSYDI